MTEDIYEALSRTALLIAMDVFDSTADHRLIVDGLRATTARIVADRDNLGCVAGQTAFVTLYAQLAMMGLQVEIDAPSIDLIAPQPPLRGTELTASVFDYTADLLPGGSARPSPTPDVVYVLGSTPGPSRSVRVSGGPWWASVGGRSPALPWRGDSPVGAMAAAAAAATEGLRAAVPGIAERLGHPVPRDQRWHLLPGRQVELDLERYRVDDGVRLGDVDIISGGAITNAALYALLRVPGLSASVRVFEPDLLAISNLNRYALARASMLDWLKTTMLESYATSDLRVVGHAEKFDDTTALRVTPLAPRLLVGVDHIPSRWVAQRHAMSSWLSVGSSSHDYVLVSTHPTGTACAGCVHPRDDAFAGEISTISFVSFWAGLVQALELILEAAGRSPRYTRSTNIWPFGLENRHGFHPLVQASASDCPVRCPASTARRAA